MGMVKGRPIITLETVEAMWEMYQQGYTTYQVAEAFNYTGSGVVCIFKRYNLPRRKTAGGRPPPDQEMVNAMWRAHAEGQTLVEVAKMFNYTPSAVSHIFRRYNLPRIDRRTRDRMPPGQVQAMYDYYQKGHSLEETAQKFNCTSVIYHFKRHNLPRRPGGTRPKVGVRRKYIYHDWLHGMSIKEIAEKYGLTNVYIRRVIRKTEDTETEG